MVTTKFKPRPAPTPEEMRERQEAATRLLALEKWTEEPLNPPAVGPASEITPVVITPATVLEVAHAPDEPLPSTPVEPPAVVRVVQPTPRKQAAAVRAMKPWERPDASKAHPYHLVLNEGQFQKMDTVWKRLGYKSMREWAIEHLEGEANKQLKALGEL